MTNTKHTPGPWRVAISPKRGYYSIVANTTDGTVGNDTIAHLSSGRRRIAFDAALLAAAPEQRAALQCLVDTVCALLADGSITIPDERLQSLENAAREGQLALDKARGES